MAETSKTQYEQTTNDENLVEEDISPEILKILGLEDIFDFDYGDYKTLLREKLTELDIKASQSKGKAVDKKISKSQTLLTGEFKRVRRSTGKFKVKSQKVKADKFVNKKAESGTGKVKPIDSSKLLPPGGVLAKRQPQDEIKPVKKEEEEEPKQKQEDLSNFFKNLLDSLKGISSVVEDLLKVLEKQLGLDKKREESQRKQSELGQAKQEEKDLEKEKKDTGSGLLKKITKPFTSIFDTITNFLLNVLMGSIVVWLLKVRSFIDTINSALKGFIDILNNALKILPGSPQIGTPQVPNIPEPPQIQSPDITGEKKQQQQSPQGAPIQLKFNAGSIAPIKQSDKKQMTFDDKVSNEGGTVRSDTTSYDVSGLGPDKHLTALETNEYVLKKGAADYLGGPAYLDGINKMFGGSTKRQVASIGDIKVQAANEGGSIGFDPAVYMQGSDQRTINVGSGAAAKRYAVAYKREGSSGTFTVKQINKVVKGAGLSMIFGQKDQLTGIKPSSQEGKTVINSAALNQWLMSKTSEAGGKLKIQVDPQADIYFAYKQAYNTHYNDSIKSGLSKEVATRNAIAAGKEFAVSRKSGSWLPGSKEGLDPTLKQVEVTGSPSSDSGTAPDDTTKGKFAKSFIEVLGDPAKDSPRLKSENAEKNSASAFLSPQSKANANEQKTDVKIEGDLAKSVLGKKNESEKTAPAISSSSLTSPASIAASTKPKQDIPKPPSNKPTITALPLPSKPQVPTNTGVSNQSGNSVPGFSSYRQEEPTLAVVASIYNMWGGL
jgi:hypothetical protein